ncbi:RagB/SusD family nutrient uptake outer membrane protein [Bacteroides sp. 224]|uniref:RagB/SusD family nutrient uptake outer membrane protein n=1 Tax=Bacteroides sp. 224 TaxID=2302936 RepID=UPI0013D3D298|nr:RagB/SusD family nutrient uptake outer membrane protein [Bacteroides sp. 224]NDV65164.1 RagB/SusD family nutrient uptake outer membrane protein [Bacteroides sp. 224]
MIHKIKYYILLAVISLGAASCLDKFPDGDGIPQERGMQSLSDADQRLTGIYAGFKNSALYSGLLTILPDIQTDLVYGVEGYSNTYGAFWRWEILPTNTEVTSVYAALYNIIGSCNLFLDDVEGLREKLIDDDELDELLNIEGQVHFARALCYSELIKLFCKAYDPATAEKELGMAMITSYKNPEKRVRANLKDSYAFVLKDLKKAEEQITNESKEFMSYFTQTAVNALYARIYLYMQDWDKAIEYATNTIEDDYLYLASTNSLATSTQSIYKYMWTNDNSTEIIWRVGFTPTSYGGALGRVFLNYNYISYTPDYVVATWAYNLYSTNDQRRAAFFRNTTTGYSHRLTWPLLIKYEGNESFRSGYNILHVNMPKVFRMSEQYLIRAEAYCQKKEYTKAAKDITTLRTARYTTYTSTSLTADNWLEEISKERVRELYMEGFRLQDLKRWHKGFERTPQQNSIKEGSSLKIEADDPLFVWPIPQHEINSPDADIKPNESNK